jgi:hypothetical protein
MRKLTLSFDSLRVESFTVDAESRHEGTVLGHSYPNQCDPPSDSLDPGYYTCHFATCAGDTCWQSCNGTCNCGSGGCQPYSAGYTFCWGTPSCLEQCDPITP